MLASENNTFYSRCTNFICKYGKIVVVGHGYLVSLSIHARPPQFCHVAIIGYIERSNRKENVGGVQ